MIGRSSAFTYKGQPFDVKRVGRELGVRYVLEGSVRKADERVRISAQLVEAETGMHLWAHRYDSRLDDIFGVLRGSARDAPQRHRTLHAVIDWSWNLLDPAGQAAMRALSVFPGGFTADAARHLLGADALPVAEQLADLRQRSRGAELVNARWAHCTT